MRFHEAALDAESQVGWTNLGTVNTGEYFQQKLYQKLLEKHNSHTDISRSHLDVEEASAGQLPFCCWQWEVLN